MKHVWLWVEREDGQVERHFGPVTRVLRDANSRPVQTVDPVTGRLEPVPDTEYVERAYALLSPFDGQSARDVALEVDVRVLETDETGVLRQLAAAFLEIALRVTERQKRSREGRMRAPWLADFELEKMTVRVRAE